uniref:Uncharacterized protein n=1 Tax=Rhizophora mucronata TaxID=61149 RepID=A0A2P2KH97_RHIMU
MFDKISQPHSLFILLLGFCTRLEKKLNSVGGLLPLDQCFDFYAIYIGYA